MNKLLSLLLVALFLCALPLRAQAPYKFSYQAVVRDNNNKLIRNSPVGLRLSILQTSATGTLLFQETHTPLTNDNGLFSVIIGGGTLVSGSLSAIDWGSDIFFLRSEIDPLGLTSYTLTSTQQLISVPYALHCNEYQSLEDVVKRSNYAGARQLKDVKDPTDPQDAVTKYYLDSVLQNLAIVLSQPNRDTSATACDSLRWRGTLYTTSGRYMHTIKDAGCAGACDSVINLYLTILRGSHQHYYDTACTGSYTWLASGTKGHGTGTSYSSAGKFAGAEYDNDDNCPSFDTLHLSFGTTTQGVDTRGECGTLTWLDGNTYTANNSTAVYNTGKHNSQGCDSSVRLDLTIYDISDVVDNQTIDMGGSLTWYGNSYTTEQTDGTVKHSFVDNNGCTRDSVLHLTYNDPCGSIADPVISGTTTICPSGNTTLSVSSPQTGYTYYWSNSETGTSITVSSAGTFSCYAVTTTPACTTGSSNPLTTSVLSFNPTLSISPSSKDINVNEELAVALSANNNGGSNSGYTFSYSPTTNSSLTKKSGQLSYERTFKATTAGTYTITASTTFTKSGCSIDKSTTATITVSESSSSAPDGAVPGLFSVSSTKQVYFAKGNLYYYATATNKWQLAPNQYGFVGNSAGNTSPSSSQSKPIDLFGTGTSGFNNKYPYNTASTSSSYATVTSGGNTDWCYYNELFLNGGTTSIGKNTWRILTYSEWKYLLGISTLKRTDAALKWGNGTVNGVYGLFILPDTWTDPKKNTYNSGNFAPASSNNSYTAANWTIMENAGAVFLPCGGKRSSSAVSNSSGQGSNPTGYYWCNSAYYMYFIGSTSGIATVTSCTSSDYKYGYSVRPVKDK